MASIAIMIAGAIINATAFVGGNYLAKYLSGDSAGEEKNDTISLWRSMKKNVKSINRIEQNFSIG